MKTLMKTLMTARNSRNLCRRAKHQVRALVNLRPDKTPAQGVHESGHEGFMISEQVCGVGPCGCTDRTIRTDKTTAQGVHDCIREPLMTAPRLVDVGERCYLTQVRKLRVTPSPALKWSFRNTARLRRSPALRRRGRPLYPHSAVGRSLTAGSGVGGRLPVFDGGPGGARGGPPAIEQGPREVKG